MGKLDEKVCVITGCVSGLGKQFAIRMTREGANLSLVSMSFEFHHEVAVASGNVVYPMIMKTFRDVCVSFFRATEGVYPWADALALYRRMAGLIAQGDVDAAVSAQQEELARWYEYTKE